jgi:hypothetical protein
MASKRKAKKEAADELSRTGRLHIRVRDDEERAAFHAYALRHSTSITALVTTHLRKLLAEEYGLHDVEQI